MSITEYTCHELVFSCKNNFYVSIQNCIKCSSSFGIIVSYIFKSSDICRNCLNKIQEIEEKLSYSFDEDFLNSKIKLF